MRKNIIIEGIGDSVVGDFWNILSYKVEDEGKKQEYQDLYSRPIVFTDIFNSFKLLRL